MGDQRVHQRSVAWPAAGCTTRPAGLSMTMMSSSSKTISSAISSPCGAGSAGLRHVDYDRIAGGDMISGVADGGGSDGYGARKDQRFQPRARQLGELAASTRSSRTDPSSPATVTRSFLSMRAIHKDEPCMTAKPPHPNRPPSRPRCLPGYGGLMLIAGLTTAVAVAAVLVAIGYRLFRSEGSASCQRHHRRAAQGRPNLRHGGCRRPADADAGSEAARRNPHLRCEALKPTGRLKFANEP